MRTLVISDVHGNLEALEAVLRAEPWDELVCLGDLVAYGPSPLACVARIRDADAVVVQGNHDRAMAEGIAPRCRPAFERLAEVTHAFARAEVTAPDLEYLGALPRWLFLELGGRRHLVVHAAPTDPLYRYLGPDPETWAREVGRAGAEVILVGHTHLQFRLEVGGVPVVNPGSVGQPKDGEPSAAYAVIEDRMIHLRRVTYAVEETVAALKSRGLPQQDFEDLAEILRTGTVPPRLTASA